MYVCIIHVYFVVIKVDILFSVVFFLHFSWLYYNNSNNNNNSIVDISD